jgi:hypothetical protein
MQVQKQAQRLLHTLTNFNINNLNRRLTQSAGLGYFDVKRSGFDLTQTAQKLEGEVNEGEVNDDGITNANEAFVLSTHRSFRHPASVVNAFPTSSV